MSGRVLARFSLDAGNGFPQFNPDASFRGRRVEASTFKFYSAGEPGPFMNFRVREEVSLPPRTSTKIPQEEIPRVFAALRRAASLYTPEGYLPPMIPRTLAGIPIRAGETPDYDNGVLVLPYLYEDFPRRRVVYAFSSPEPVYPLVKGEIQTKTYRIKGILVDNTYQAHEQYPEFFFPDVTETLTPPFTLAYSLTTQGRWYCHVLWVVVPA